MLKENFHTHTQFCHHAVGLPIDYVNEGKKVGIEALGFSEHTPYKYSNYGMRPDLSDMESYFAKIAEAAQEAPAMAIFRGLEMDIRADYFDFYKALSAKYQLHFHAGAIHFLPNGTDVFSISSQEEMHNYFALLMVGAESGLFDFIAHPDRFCVSRYCVNHIKEYYKLWEDFIIVVQKNKLILELNASHFNYDFYQRKEVSELWHIATQYRTKVIINSDAHHPKHLIKNFEPAYNYANQANLELISFYSYLKGGKVVF